jgi:cyclophilin family peptidyl-prolyl cis-trans isomerase
MIDHWDDQYAECAAWADNFQCEKNPKFMLRKCIESCYLHDTVHAAVLSGKPSVVNCESTVGPFVLELQPNWAPWGVNRFLKLVSDGYFNGSPLNRSHFFVNFGNTPNKDLLSKWNSIPPIPDDLSSLKPVESGFKRGMVSFSSRPSDGRSTNLFIILADDETLGMKPWETPIGQVVEGLTNLRTTKNIATYRHGDVPVIKSCTAELPEEAQADIEADFNIVIAPPGTESEAAKIAAAARVERRKRIRRADRVKEMTT